MNNLQEKCKKLLDLYSEIKRHVRQTDAYLFERWKAGGFLVDSDIVSMYPNLEEVMESLQEGADSEEDIEDE